MLLAGWSIDHANLRSIHPRASAGSTARALPVPAMKMGRPRRGLANSAGRAGTAVPIVRCGDISAISAKCALNLEFSVGFFAGQIVHGDISTVINLFIFNNLWLNHASRFFAGNSASNSAMLGVVTGAIHYQLPDSWIAYDRGAIDRPLLEAKAAILALQAIPFQRGWVRELRDMELKLEVAGTSRIENASFVGDELERAIRAQTPEELHTRSQRQANAAARAYEWVKVQPDDRPISPLLIKELHGIIVTGCDDDHCDPGGLRRMDQNVTFGSPRHRGVLGGPECDSAVDRLAQQASTTFREHDPLIQALALHYHFAAMHPFLDGNGRTARALEALVLKRAGLHDVVIVPMSNFYYREVNAYFAALSEACRRKHDLTRFLTFALRGLAEEVSRLTSALREAVSREIYRIFLDELFATLASTRGKVIVTRQLELLSHLLKKKAPVEWGRLVADSQQPYAKRKDQPAAIARDISKLLALDAVKLEWDQAGHERPLISVDLDWPGTITETEFFKKIKKLPTSKDYAFLTKP